METRAIDAHLEGMEIDQTAAKAFLILQVVGGERLMVTVPLDELGALHRDLAHLLELTPYLFLPIFPGR